LFATAVIKIFNSTFTITVPSYLALHLKHIWTRLVVLVVVVVVVVVVAAAAAAAVVKRKICPHYEGVAKLLLHYS